MEDKRDGKTRESVESVLASFDSRKPTLEAFCSKTRTLIEKCLQHGGVRYQSVQGRVKNRDKLRAKYQNLEKQYKKLDDITDQAALRVITYYEDEVDKVAEIIGEEFEVNSGQSVDRRKTDPDRFGYYGLNLVCKHRESRRSDVEYREFSDVICEIQVTSILRHAWSEIEHAWYDNKGVYPDSVKRRFYLLAALLELAEAEFLAIKKTRVQHLQSLAVQVQAMVRGLPLDDDSMRSFLLHEPQVTTLDAGIAEILGLEVSHDLNDSTNRGRTISAGLAGFREVDDLREFLTQYNTGLLEYVRECNNIWSADESLELHPTVPLERGSSVYYASMMKIASQGEDGLRDFMVKLQITEGFSHVGRQVAKAREIMNTKDKGRLPSG